ncbi:hypothetical protein [Shewanella sp. BC20]|uniref:hypothetical protein n=1 Tax=Shewanella sp. BC20 TaxID=2004459 RepID=UPI0011B20E88|nr:hypothetical protein [Shewanella sp. BC20]
MKTFAIIVILMSLLSCSAHNNFNYAPTNFGLGKEGYEETLKSDGTWEVKVIAMNSYSKEILEHYFHRRASEICGGYNYSLVSFNQMIDVCSEGGCFKQAVVGEFKCI